MDGDRESVAVTPLECGGELFKADHAEAIGKREIFVEQAIAGEGTRPEWQQGMVVLEAHRLDDLRPGVDRP